MIRQSARLLIPRGRYSSMMDLGASPSGKSSKRIDVGKNNRIKCIAFDFSLITRNLEQEKTANPHQPQQHNDRNHDTSTATPATILPNASMVQELASVLNIQLGGTMKSTKSDDRFDDNLSALTGDANFPPPAPPPAHPKPYSHSDVRSKYASKLRTRLPGGIASVDRVKFEQTLGKGDAASGWAEARAAAVSSGNSGSASSRWLASTGTANLLTFLTNRSVKIALLPAPLERDHKSGERMKEFRSQLPNVRVDLCVDGVRTKDGEEDEDSALPGNIVEFVLKECEILPLATLLVSDRDDYLKAARDRGVFTCRVRAKNARRGNVTTDFTVGDMKAVEEVVNELNGISFNSVLN